MQETNTELMELIKKNHEEQKKQTRFRNILMMIVAAAAAGVFITVMFCALTVIPEATAAIRDMERIAQTIDGEELQEIIEETGALAEEASEIMDIAKDGLTQAGSAVEKIDSIDIEKLNEAIGNLNKTVKPLADFFSRWN